MDHHLIGSGIVGDAQVVVSIVFNVVVPARNGRNGPRDGVGSNVRYAAVFLNADVIGIGITR